MGTGFLNTTGLLVSFGLTLAALFATAFFEWLTAPRRVFLTDSLDLDEALAICRFAALEGDLAFGLFARIGLAVRTFAALRARAFPAGERLVAGLRRVDLPATTRFREDEVADEWRGEERDESFFTLLAIGLLMRKALDSKTIHHKDAAKNKARA